MVTECMEPGCTVSFSTFQHPLWKRRHHCRLCGRVICGECSKYRMVLEQTNKPVRVCCSCYCGHMNDGTKNGGPQR